MTRIIDGKALAEKLQAKLAEKQRNSKKKQGRFLAW